MNLIIQVNALNENDLLFLKINYFTLLLKNFCYVRQCGQGTNYTFPNKVMFFDSINSKQVPHMN